MRLYEQISEVLKKCNKCRKSHPTRVCLVCTKPSGCLLPVSLLWNMDVLLGYCTFQLKFFLTLVNTKVILAGVAASKAQTRVLRVPEMNFPCQICRRFWLHHLTTAFCFAVQHMCCCVYVNLCIYIFRRKMCEERKEKGFHMPSVGRCVSTFDLLSFSYVS